MYDLHPPEAPLDRKMTEAQIRLLRRIVETNGGGVSVLGSPYYRAAKGLMDRHMIQGKRGNPAIAVHTKRGLDWVRTNPQE